MGNKHTKQNEINVKDINNKDNDLSIPSPKKIYKYNIVFVRERGIGTKTSLIQRIKEGKYIDITDKNKEKHEKIIYTKDNKKFILYLLDTNTEKEKNFLTETTDNKNYITNYYKNADCIIMGYDATNKESFEEIKTFWYNKIKENTKINLIYLLGNKIDLKNNIIVKSKDAKKFSDKYKIKYFSISVKNDINIQKFIEDIKINIENIDNKVNNGINEIIYGNPSKQIYKAVFLGESGVGNKTSFINAIVSQTFDPNTISTITSSYSVKSISLNNGNIININLWDTVGQEMFREFNKLFIRDSDIIVLGYALNSKDTFESIKNYWYQKSKDISGSDLIYLIENKIDLESDREVNEEEAIEYARNNNLRFFKVSCKNFIGINEFLNDLTDELLKK